MVDLIEIFKGGITPQDVCLDPCAGTGTFLLSFFDKQVSKYKNIEKAKENLIGIEKNSEMYVLSVANMLSHGDGKANLYFNPTKGCFNFNSASFLRTPNIGLMNPPYSQAKKKIGDNKSEIEFVEKLGECIKNGYFAVITPLSTFTNKTEININKKKNIYQRHTLKAIINMPEKLFFPISVHTCVAIFQSEKPHTLADQVYFYNLEYDGYEIFNEVRQDYFKK
jgi:type I restriction enzyme M protein